MQSINLYDSSDTLAASVADGCDAQPLVIAASKKTQLNQILERFMRHPFIEVVAIVWVGLLCAGCAPEIGRTAIPYVQNNGTKEVIQLTQSTTVPNYSGAGTTLFIGTRWDHVGEVAHGKVYRSKDSVFFLRGANTHEAYLVVKGKKLVGFYLPGDKAWSVLEPSLDIEFGVN